VSNKRRYGWTKLGLTDVLIPELSCICAYQVTYIGNTTVMHGLPGGTPAGIITLADDEQIITIDGWAGLGVNIMRFTTNKGNVYGPWGGPGGWPYKIEGPVLGFYGATAGTWISAIGIWTLPSSSPRPPPFPPPSPPVFGRIQSPAFGDQSTVSVTWDDGALFTGHCPYRATVQFLVGF
jgi:hypothetical protein